MEIKAYSAYGEYDGCSSRATEGYVKINGVAVWRSSWCGRYSNYRGINLFLIDPFGCYVQRRRRFDTHISTTASTQLTNYVQLVNHGSIIVGVSADEATWHWDNALPGLKQIGADVSDVQHRGSFAFVARKNFPMNTVVRKVLTESQSYANPARLNARITGIELL